MFSQYNQVKSFLQNRGQYGVKPGLSRIKELLYLLNDPQYLLNAVHIAGTNGKGSTAQYLRGALNANNYRVGVFQSPSLTDYTGHISIDNMTISQNEFIDCINRVYPAVKQLDDKKNYPTEFEIITAATFLYFVDKTDIALIETGMGGKEDTTNCFIPILSIITNVSWDHMSFLGNTLSEIASHKAGVIKENRPVITGAMNDESHFVIQKEAHEKNAPLYKMNEFFDYEIMDSSPSVQTFRWSSRSGLSFDVTLKTAGIYQIQNVSAAIMALSLLENHGYELDWQSSIDGLAHTEIPGRFEKVFTKPTIILDGAHNLKGVETFTNALERNFADREKHLILAVFYDKDLKNMMESLEPYFSSITLTTFEHPRAATVEQLRRYCHHPSRRLINDWQEAIKQISFEHKNDCYCITGSMHFISLARNFMQETFNL